MKKLIVSIFVLSTFTTAGAYAVGCPGTQAGRADTTEKVAPTLTQQEAAQKQAIEAAALKKEGEPSKQPAGGSSVKIK